MWFVPHFAETPERSESKIWMWSAPVGARSTSPSTWKRRTAMCEAFEPKFRSVRWTELPGTGLTVTQVFLCLFSVTLPYVPPARYTVPPAGALRTAVSRAEREFTVEAEAPTSGRAPRNASAAISATSTRARNGRGWAFASAVRFWLNPATCYRGAVSVARAPRLREARTSYDEGVSSQCGRR